MASYRVLTKVIQAQYKVSTALQVPITMEKVCSNSCLDRIQAIPTIDLANGVVVCVVCVAEAVQAEAWDAARD